MSTRLRIWCLGFVLALLWGCSSDSTTTALTLTVDSDLTVPDQLDRVTVSVVGQEVAQDPEADLREQPLPRSLTLVHDAGPLGPVMITVRGWLGTQLVVQKALTATFVSGRDPKIAVQLERACAGLMCDVGQTCEDGTCTAIKTMMDDGGTPPDDASRPHDATVVDARVPDAEADAALDASSNDASTPDAGDASMQSDASLPDAAAPDAAAPDAALPTDAALPPGAGAPPVCSITTPASGDSYQINTAVDLIALCNDPETGIVTKGLTWTSNVEGALGTGPTTSATFKRLGAQRVTVCAADPRDATVTGCASSDITITLIAQPTATIVSITQNGSATQPFVSNLPITFTGSGSGASLQYAWNDDLQGALGAGATVTVMMPFVGRHTVTLRVTDIHAVSKTATRSYVVVAPGETNLVSPYTNVNTTLDAAGDPGVTMIASDPLSRAYVPNSSGPLYRFDGNALASPAVVAVGQPPINGVVQDAFLAVDKAVSYLATSQGLTVCGYAAMNGVAEPCKNFGASMITQQSTNLLSVLRMSVPSPIVIPVPPGNPTTMTMDVLLEGTDNGVFMPNNVAGSTTGTIALRGRRINDMIAVQNQAALATDNGLYMFAPVTQANVRYSTTDGLPSNQLSSLALGSDGSIWIGSSAGLTRFQPSLPKWTTYTVDTGLAGNRVNGVVVQHVTTLSPARDIVWVASSGGVTRLDTQTNTLQKFTTADGLPSNEILAVNVLANGIKLFGTSKGLAHFAGP